MSHSQEFFAYVIEIARAIDCKTLDAMAEELNALRKRSGRLFILGVGGSAANCSHAVNDFRKLCGIEAYTPVDNVAELTARPNDEGWETIFSEWMKVSRVGKKDAILIFSVGGGDAERGISINLIRAIDEAKRRGARVFGVVGRAHGYTAKMGDCVVVIPSPAKDLVTPLSEGFQAVGWHCLMSDRSSPSSLNGMLV